MVVGEGSVDRYLTDQDVRRIVRDGLAPLAIDGRRVLAIVPDGTRTMPIPMLFGVLGELLGDQVAALDYVILDYDHLLICGPVFPHEVAGFSGGNNNLAYRDPATISTEEWAGREAGGARSWCAGRARCFTGWSRTAG